MQRQLATLVLQRWRNTGGKQGTQSLRRAIKDSAMHRRISLIVTHGRVGPCCKESRNNSGGIVLGSQVERSAAVGIDLGMQWVPEVAPLNFFLRVRVLHSFRAGVFAGVIPGLVARLVQLRLSNRDCTPCEDSGSTSCISRCTLVQWGHSTWHPLRATGNVRLRIKEQLQYLDAVMVSCQVQSRPKSRGPVARHAVIGLELRISGAVCLWRIAECVQAGRIFQEHLCYPGAVSDGTNVQRGSAMSVEHVHRVPGASRMLAILGISEKYQHLRHLRGIRLCGRVQ